MNSEQGKKCKNVNPVDQMIDNMTGDKQNPFSLSPPITNDNVNWVDFQQNQCQSNPFVPQFNQRQPDGINFPIEPNPRFVPQNFGNYIPQNIYMQQNYGEKLGNDGIGNKKYVMYRGTVPQYVLANPELSQVYGYVPVVHENRDFRLFSPNEMQNIPIQTNSMIGNDHEANFPQNHPEPINLVHQNIQKTPNCTHLIDNVVSKWNQNTNGTYSPFGTVQNNPPTNFYDSDTQNSVPLIENPQNFHEIPEKTDFNTISFKTNNNLKKKQVAEVKPMRPTYSDVLTKSVNSQTPKFEKNDPQNPKNKSSLKKSAKISKINNLTRQNSNNNENQNNLSAKFEKSEKINNLGRKWVSLDDVNEMNHTNLFKDVSDNKNTNIKNKNSNFINSNNTKKFENTAKNSENNFAKNGLKKGFLDSSSTLGCQWSENSDENFSESYLKNEDKNFGKNPSKKGKESRSNSLRQLRERGNEKPPGSAKRNQRMRKRENHGNFATIGRTLQHYLSKWSKVVFKFLLWLLHLISDIFSMSVHLTRDFGMMLWDNIVLYSKSVAESATNIFKKVTIFTKIGGYLDRVFGEYSWAFWRKNENEHQNIKTEGKNWLNSGLEHNIQMPQTGEEAMKRLLACKGKDPYSILGVRPDCSDDDIKKYYKRQAFLVHPDKNPQPGAEEAFKILVHAFDIIGEPERRQSYDRKVAESHQVEQAWSELNDLLSQLQTKMEYAANTIRCTNCSKRHRRLNVNRPCYAARNCAQCKIHHSAKEGDIWAESKYFGFYWHYYACMDGAVYDITEWAGCQRKNLKHLRPNSHNVQYRIVLGKQGQTGGPSREKRHKNSTNNTDREADLENFLNNLYNQSDLSNGAQSPTHSDVNGRNSTESAKCRKKNKRKK